MGGGRWATAHIMGHLIGGGGGCCCGNSVLGLAKGTPNRSLG